MIDSLRLFNIAMGNVPFVDDDIHELSIKNGEFPVVESPYGVILSSIFSNLHTFQKRICTIPFCHI